MKPCDYQNNNHPNTNPMAKQQEIQNHYPLTRQDSMTILEKPSHQLIGKALTLHCPYCGIPFKVHPSHQNQRDYRNNTYHRKASRKFEIDPEELGQLVWEVPITQIAVMYGVSDKAVEKRCRALGIPMPPRGYWTRLNLEIGFEEELG